MTGGADLLVILDLAARWIHLIAAIMWVGNSLLWNWLDRNLVASRPGEPTQTATPIGSIWLLHSGAFYYMEKTLLAGAPLPTGRMLHWFKWQAYTTWWSGLALLIAVYWVGGRATLTDPAVATLTSGAALALAIGGIVGGWLLYDGTQRLVAPRAPRLAMLIWMPGLAGIAVLLLQLLGPRAAFVHVGAMLGTIMAGNVVFTIMPAQRELVATVAESRGASKEGAAASARAKRVSIHNNYFVFPVIALMLTAHFPALYGHPLNWLLLVLLVAMGAVVRHTLNIRFTFAAWRRALAATLAVGLGAIYAVLRWGAATPVALSAGDGPVAFADVRHVIDRRCASCHAAEPSDLTFGVAPGGVRFDTPEQITALATRIEQRVVVTQTMPPANKTRLTDAERALLARWIAQGAGQLPR